MNTRKPENQQTLRVFLKDKETAGNSRPVLRTNKCNQNSKTINNMNKCHQNCQQWGSSRPRAETCLNCSKYKRGIKFRSLLLLNHQKKPSLQTRFPLQLLPPVGNKDYPAPAARIFLEIRAT